RQTERPTFGERDELLGLGGVHRERLLHVHMGTVFKALASDRKVTVGWCRDVHDLRPRLVQEPPYIIERMPDLEPLSELSGHQVFPIADGHEVASLGPPDLLGVGISDLPATDNGHAKRHRVLVHGSFRNTAGVPRRSSRSESSPDAIWPSHWSSGCLSSMRAM